MRLNPDLIRDIVLYVEEKSGYYKTIRITDVSRYLEKYQKHNLEAILYHIRYCDLSGLFYGCRPAYMGRYIDYSRGTLVDLSPKGHEFAGNIHNDSNWNKVKKTAGRVVGSYALPALISIASGITQTAIQSALKI